VYGFGDIRVDLGRMTASRGGSVVPLEPKAFDVLVYLIERRERLVTKDELLDAMWPGTFVTPNALTRVIAQIRKALGDESQDARCIETVAKRGYRFIAPVSVMAAPAVPSDLMAAGAHLAPPARSWRWPKPFWVVAPALAMIFVALAAFYPRTRVADPLSSDVHLRRLTNRRGYSGTPALSPDGRALVYASDATGGLELYLVNLLEGSPEVPLTSDGGQNIQPAWSPDGQWIAFHSRRRDGIWILPSTGGVPRQLTDFGSDPAWSPDSTTLVFTSDAGGMAAQSSLWTVHRDGSDRRALTRLGKPLGGHRAPAWSHDGRRVVFTVSSGRWHQQIWIVDVSSGATRQLTESMNAADVCFAPDDRSLLWGGTTEAGNGRLFRMRVAADGSPAGAPEVVLPMDVGAVDSVTVAANGTMAFAQKTLDANLWASDVGPNGRGANPVRLTDDVARNTLPDYSPDGRIAYMQVSVGSPPSVWIMKDDGSGRTPLLPGAGASDPQWDRGGDRIMVVRGAPDGTWAFVRVDVASRRMAPTTLSLSDILSPRLSPDGREIAFHHLEPDGAMTTWIGGFDGSRTRIAADPEAVSYPAWSPDGKWLALELKRGDATHVAVVPRGGGAVEQLTEEAGQSWPHSWAPDNDRIAFAGERHGVWNIYTVSRRSHAVAQVTSFTSPAGYLRYPAWSPNGSRVVFERAVETSAVWTMTLPPDK
jgi:Tol biopolymer transport system component/DNA-binding winged helix-turn-helix (wHTH) protein